MPVASRRVERLRAGQLVPQPLVAVDARLSASSSGSRSSDSSRRPAGPAARRRCWSCARSRSWSRWPLESCVVQLAGLGVDQVGGERARVAPEQRVGQRAVAPEEADQVQPDEQHGQRVEQPCDRVRADVRGEQRPVRQRELQVPGDQDRVERLAVGVHAVQDDADGVRPRGCRGVRGRAAAGTRARRPLGGLLERVHLCRGRGRSARRGGRCRGGGRRGGPPATPRAGCSTEGRAGRASACAWRRTEAWGPVNPQCCPGDKTTGARRAKPADPRGRPRSTDVVSSVRTRARAGGGCVSRETVAGGCGEDVDPLGVGRELHLAPFSGGRRASMRAMISLLPSPSADQAVEVGVRAELLDHRHLDGRPFSSLETMRKASGRMPTVAAASWPSLLRTAGRSGTV